MADPGEPRRRRWPGRLLVLATAVGAAFAYRGWRLAEADRRYPAPPRAPA